MTNNKHSAFIALIGRPNAGKSTLLNAFLNSKISITTHKPQTTQKRIVGIKTIGNNQLIFVDTPGIHKKTKRKINKYMNETAFAALKDVDIILFITDAVEWNEDDTLIINEIIKLNLKKPVYCIINKQDKLNNKAEVLPLIAQREQLYNFKKIIPISALNNSNLDNLEKTLLDELQELPATDYFFYPEDQITDQRVENLAAELIREQLLLSLGQELPYTTAVVISEYKQEETITRISATIWVERDQQKAIIIGSGGQKLKSIGTKARLNIEKLINQKVFLQLWVKVKDKWSDDTSKLNTLGFY